MLDKYFLTPCVLKVLYFAKFLWDRYSYYVKNIRVKYISFRNIDNNS